MGLREVGGAWGCGWPMGAGLAARLRLHPTFTVPYMERGGGAKGSGRGLGIWLANEGRASSKASPSSHSTVPYMEHVGGAEGAWLANGGRARSKSPPSFPPLCHIWNMGVGLREVDKAWGRG